MYREGVSHFTDPPTRFVVLSPGRTFDWVVARFRAVSKAEWAAIAGIIAMLFALLPPTPQWREISCKSCHLCGNRQATTLHYRWWNLDRSVTEPLGTTYPVDKDHAHDWWQYSHSYISYSTNWASSNSARYRDGRYEWNP